MIKQLVEIANRTYENFVTMFPRGFSLFPRNVIFELLYHCNLSCEMCYLRLEEIQRHLKPKKILNTIEVKRIIDKIPKFVSISFTGGEPFLRKDVFEILSYAAAKHRVGVISNLVLLNKAKTEKLLTLNLNSLMFSIDGDEKHHDKIRGKGNFLKTFQNAANLIMLRNKKGLKRPFITLNCVIQPGIVKVLDKVALIATKLDVNKCNFQLFDPSIDRSGYSLKPSLSLEDGLSQKIPNISARVLSDSIQKAEKILKKSNIPLSFTPNFTKQQILDYYRKKINLQAAYCRQPYFSLRISPFGEVYPCYNLFLGNLIKESFWQIWNKSEYRDFRRNIKEGKFLEFCVGCCHLKLKNI